MEGWLLGHSMTVVTLYGPLGCETSSKLYYETEHVQMSMALLSTYIPVSYLGSDNDCYSDHSHWW